MVVGFGGLSAYFGQKTLAASAERLNSDFLTVKTKEFDGNQINNLKIIIIRSVKNTQTKHINFAFDDVTDW